MIRLSFLMNEGDDAAEQAHKLGLQAGGWGYWKDKTGKTVAKTIDGHLVKIKPDNIDFGHGVTVDTYPEHPNDSTSPDNVKQAYGDFEDQKVRSANSGASTDDSMSDDEFNQYMNYVAQKAKADKEDPYHEDNIHRTMGQQPASKPAQPSNNLFSRVKKRFGI